MRRRTGGLAIAMVALVGVLAFTFRTGRSVVPSANGGDGVAVQPSDRPTLRPGAELARGANPVTSREAVDARPAEISPSAALLVRVVDKRSGKGLAGVRVYGSKLKDLSGGTSSGTDASKGDFVHPPLTDAEGRAEVAVPSDVDLSIWVRGERVECEDRDLEVPKLRASERRDLVVELLLGDDLDVFGKVVDKGTRGRIPGARVKVSFVPWGGNPADDRKVAQLSEATTDGDGNFELRMPSWKRAYVRIEAEGYGVAVVRHLEGHATPEQEIVVEIERSATLEARVVDPQGGPVAGVRFELAAEGYTLPLIESVWSGEYVHVPDERWVGLTGADGTCELPGLVAAVGIRIELHHEGRLVRREPELLLLEAGQTLKREWTLGAGCDLNGLAIDQDEKPAPGLEIWLSKTDPGPGHYFETQGKRWIAANATTDAEGRFAFADVEPGTWWLGPAPRERGWTLDDQANPRRAEHDPKSVAPVAAMVEVMSVPSQDVTLRVQRGLFIRGTVVDAEGKGVEDCNVTGTPHASEWGPQTESQEDGTFVLGPIADGGYSLRAEAMNRFPPSDAVEARAGDSGIVLKMRAGGGIRARVVDARTGGVRGAEILLTPHVAGEGIFGEGMGTGVNDDGVLDLQGLVPGAYDLAAYTDDGCFGLLRDLVVVAGETGKESVLTVSPGGVLKMTYVGVRPHVDVDVRIEGVRVDWGQRLERGKTFEKPAPAGSLTLEIRDDSDAPPKRRVVRLGIGEKQEIRIGDDG